MKPAGDDPIRLPKIGQGEVFDTPSGLAAAAALGQATARRRLSFIATIPEQHRAPAALAVEPQQECGQ